MARKRKRKTVAEGRPSRAKGQVDQRRVNDVAAAREDAQATVIAARRRHMARDLGDMAAHPMAGCPAGLAVIAHADSAAEWPDLWTAILHMRRVYAAYDRVFGANRFPKVAAILAPTEAMQTSADAPAYDDRTDREKQDAATNAWMTLHGWMMRVSRQTMAGCIEGVIHETDRPVRDVDGMLACLRVVSKGIKGEFAKPLTKATD